MFEETIDDGVGFLGRIVLGAIGHGDALGETEQAVDGDRVSKHGPTRGRVFGAAADEKRTRCHEGVEFVEIVALRDEFRVGTGAWGGRGNEATRACRVYFFFG